MIKKSKYCGAKLKDHVYQGPQCVENTSLEILQEFKESKNTRFSCGLSYWGFLFWVPLVFCPKAKHAKVTANHGLWSLIVTFMAFAMVRVVRWIGSLLALGPLGFITNPLNVLSTMLFLFLMMYLVMMCWKNAMTVCHGDTPQPMLFFDYKAIIK